MSRIVPSLSLATITAVCSLAAAQQPASPRNSVPQSKPVPIAGDSAPAKGPKLTVPAPLQFGFLVGSAAEGKLTLVVPQVAAHAETRTRTERVMENGVEKPVQYLFKVMRYAVVPATLPVELKDVLRWDGAAAASATADVVQRFIDARAPVLLIENQQDLARAPVYHPAIRRGALLVQSQAGVAFAVKPPIAQQQPSPDLNITLPKDPPPQLVTVVRSHDGPQDADVAVVGFPVPVPVTQEITQEFEENGEKRTGVVQIQVFQWAVQYKQTVLSQWSVTDKAGVPLSAEDVKARLVEPTLCVDGRYRPFDPAYLVTLSDTVLILTQSQTDRTADQAGQPAPAIAQPAAGATQPSSAASVAADEWVGRSVIPKPGIQLKVAGTNSSLDWRSIGPLPWKVTHEKGDWIWIGKTWAKKSQVVRLGDSPRDQGLARFSEAVRNDATDPWHYVNRSYYWEPHDVASTIADLTEALRLDPNNDYAASARREALKRQQIGQPNPPPPPLPPGQ